MTVSFDRLRRPAAGVAIAPTLRRLAYRRSERPQFTPKWPCPQLDQESDAELHDALAAAITALPGVT